MAKHRVRSEEEYLHYIEAMELEPGDFVDYETLRDKLARQLGISPDEVTAGHIGGAYRGYEDIYNRLSSVGVTPRIIHYNWGSVLRFAIKGMRGWYSFGYVKSLYEILSGEPW